jgi:hypothetical protein
LDALLLALATTAGTRLVTAMTDDGWGAVRSRVAALLGRGDPEAVERQEQRLDRSQVELASASSTSAPEELGRLRERQAAAWATRFEDALADDPGLASTLQELVSDLQRQGAAAAAGSVQVNAQASDQAQQAVQGQGVQTNTFGPPTRDR